MTSHEHDMMIFVYYVDDYGDASCKMIQINTNTVCTMIHDYMIPRDLSTRDIYNAAPVCLRVWISMYMYIYIHTHTYTLIYLRTDVCVCLQYMCTLYTYIYILLYILLLLLLLLLL